MKLIQIPGIVNNKIKEGEIFPKYSFLKISDSPPPPIFVCLYSIELKSAIMITIWPFNK